MKSSSFLLLKIKTGESKNFIYFLLVGMISVLGQTILLREMLVEVMGNEIIYSVFLSIWLLVVALGSLFHKLIPLKNNISNKISLLLILLILIQPFQFILIRYLITQITAISGIVLSIPSLFLLSLIILSPGCFLIGYIFPANVNLHSQFSSPIKKVYILESIGMILGGIIFFLLIHVFRGFTILFICGLITSVFLYFINKKLSFLSLIIIFFLLALFSNKIFLANYKTKYEPAKLLKSYDSKYGRFDITEDSGQKNYFWDGVLFANSQNDNYAKELVNFVLLQHKNPQEVLLAGGLLNGYPKEILHNSNAKIDYLELDKNVIQASIFFRKNNKRINLIQEEIVHFLNDSNKKYDIIYLDLPNPSSLFLNRFYSNSFFDLMKSHLKNKFSVGAITVGSGENLLLPELAHLNKTIYNTFSELFTNTVIIPAEKNIFVGSEENYITNYDNELIKRMNSKKISDDWFNKGLIKEICFEFRIQKFNEIIASGVKEVNQVLKPVAFISTVQFWVKHLDIDLTREINFIKDNKFLVLCTIIFLIFILSLIAKSEDSYSKSLVKNSIIISSSLVVFVMQIILIYLFQVYYGYVYYVIAIFTAVFMVGLSLGFLLKRIIKSDSTIFLAVLATILLIILLIIEYRINPLFYFIFNLIISLLEGLILSSVLDCKGQEQDSIKQGAGFYFADTIGAFLGGLIFGVVLLPLYGIKFNIKFLALIICINFIISLIAIKRDKELI